MKTYFFLDPIFTYDFLQPFLITLVKITVLGICCI